MKTAIGAAPKPRRVAHVRTLRQAAAALIDAVLKGLAFAAAVVTPIALAAQSASPGDAFVIVRRAEYEGAIIPASSPWHQVVRDDPGIRNELTVLDGWTPTAQQISAAEDALRVFIDRGLVELKSGKAPSGGVFVRGDIRALADNLPGLKRQYVGLVTKNARLVLVHGFPDDPAQRWQTEAIVIMGAWCRQFWIDFSVTQQRITRLRCGSLD